MKRHQKDNSSQTMKIMNTFFYEKYRNLVEKKEYTYDKMKRLMQKKDVSNIKVLIKNVVKS
jgi:hypothetical protein